MRTIKLEEHHRIADHRTMVRATSYPSHSFIIKGVIIRNIRRPPFLGVWVVGLAVISVDFPEVKAR